MNDASEVDTERLLAFVRWITAARENQENWDDADHAVFALEVIQRAEAVLYGS